MTASVTTSPPTKRGRPGYDQESVLSIAVEVFNKHGYDATSMGKLAENLGISKSAIYHHVPSKGDLLRLGHGRRADGRNTPLLHRQSNTTT